VVKVSKRHATESMCSAGYVMHSFAAILFPSFDSSSYFAGKKNCGVPSLRPTGSSKVSSRESSREKNGACRTFSTNISL
jgi:hypothetical protein